MSLHILTSSVFAPLTTTPLISTMLKKVLLRFPEQLYVKYGKCKLHVKQMAYIYIIGSEGKGWTKEQNISSDELVNCI